MNPILHPTRTVKYIFAVLTLPLLTILAFVYVGDSFIAGLMTLYMVLPTLLFAFIFWRIDRKKQTHLRFYTNYLLVCFFALSIVIAAASRLFYEPYRVDCLKREQLLGEYLLNYHAKFGHYPANLDDPFFDNAPKGSIIPFVGKYHYERSDLAVQNIPPPTEVEKEVNVEQDGTIGAAREIDLPAPPPPTKKQIKQVELEKEVTVSIRYKSLFGRDRCFFGDCQDFEREHDGFLSNEIEEFEE